MEMSLTEGLSKQEKIALGCYLSWRLLPYYEVFSAKMAWGKPEALREIIEQAEKWLEGKPMPDFFNLRSQLFEAGPDLDEWQGLEASFALNACAACHSLMDLVEGNPGNSLREILDLWEETTAQASWQQGLAPEGLTGVDNPLIANALEEIQLFAGEAKEAKNLLQLLKKYRMKE